MTAPSFTKEPDGSRAVAVPVRQWSRQRKLFALALLIITIAEVDLNGSCGCDGIGGTRAALVTIDAPAAERATGV